MNEIEVKDLVSKLSCEYPKEEQQKAINKLSVVDDQYFGLLFNKNLKETWENIVIIDTRFRCHTVSSFLGSPFAGIAVVVLVFNMVFF